MADKDAIEDCRQYVGGLDRNAGAGMAMFWAQRLADKDFFPEAAIAFAAFARHHPENVDVALQLVEHFLNAFRIDDAERVLKRLLAQGAGTAGVEAMYARIHLTRGDVAEAAAAAKRALAADPDCVTAYVVLSEVDPIAIDESGDAHLQAFLLKEETPLEKRIVGLMALGRAREKRGDIDGAFAAFSQSKQHAKRALAHTGIRHDQPAAEALIRETIAAFPAAPIAAAKPAQGGPDEAHRLICIVGMPRSGSTLVDQILSRHSAVVSVGESMIAPEFVSGINRQSAATGRTPRDCAAAQSQAFQQRYRSAGDGAKIVIDKNLFNYQHCGLIAELDPSARFIVTLRDPMDIALSVFKIKFLGSHPWSNDFDDIAHMIASFEYLTDHWRRIFGDRILVVQHETVVSRLEPSVRELLDFCGLDFEQHCLDFHHGERAVFTTSAAQVRQPLNADGVGRWRRYERHLEGFAQSLATHRKRLAGGA
jgi:tetratricopeptide (TPR) repeat protein